MKQIVLFAAVFALSLRSLAPNACAQTSPVGTWDCVRSGKQKGIAYLTFTTNFTVNGYEVITQTPRNDRSEIIDPRNVGGGRDVPDDATDPDSLTNRWFLGFSSLNGYWNYDTKGRVVGFLTEGDEDSSQGMSFRAIVRQGQRISMTFKDSPDPLTPKPLPRKGTFRGVPPVPLHDLTGNWIVYGRIANTNAPPITTPLTAFLTLTNVASSPPTHPASGLVTNVLGFPNAYTLNSHGPNAEGYGLVLVSSQRKFGFVERVQQIEGTNSVLRAVVGSYNPRTQSAFVHGTDEENSRITARVTKSSFGPQ